MARFGWRGQSYREVRFEREMVGSFESSVGMLVELPSREKIESLV